MQNLTADPVRAFVRRGPDSGVGLLPPHEGGLFVRVGGGPATQGGLQALQEAGSRHFVA